MKHTALSAAIAEAERFLRAARKLQSVERQDPVNALARGNEWVSSYHPRESGAARRASMDLTRALAEMRRRG